MSNDFLTPIVDVKEIADAFRYSEDEYPYIKNLILSAQAYLYNAGAFKPDNPMTKNAIFVYCGEALENRDGMGYDYKNTQHLHTSMTSLINSIRYSPDIVSDTTSSTDGETTNPETVDIIEETEISTEGGV